MYYCLNYIQNPTTKTTAQNIAKAYHYLNSEKAKKTPQIQKLIAETTDTDNEEEAYDDGMQVLINQVLQHVSNQTPPMEPKTSHDQNQPPTTPQDENDEALIAELDDAAMETFRCSDIDLISSLRAVSSTRVSRSSFSASLIVSAS